MLLFEHDAKELLAIQGIPVPGGIRLEQVPRANEDTTLEKSGPWIVKPQLLGGAPGLADRIAVAETNAEVAAAAASLLGSVIDGRTVRSVWVERQFRPHALSALAFRCDPASSSIRIMVGTDGRSALSAPDPNSMITCVDDLSQSLPEDSAGCLRHAGRMLAPLFFGYEAIQMAIDPLMLLEDGGWAVGDVTLEIDENALFRHPELLSLVERREHAYRDVRDRRRFGFDNRIVAPEGRIATITAGPAYGAFLADEMTARNLPLYNVMEAGLSALNKPGDALSHLIGHFADTDSLRCLFVSIAGDVADLTDFAGRFADAIRHQPAFTRPVVARFLGSGAGAAAAILQQAAATVDIEPVLDAALGRAGAYAADSAG